jgi:hypothetical protein
MGAREGGAKRMFNAQHSIRKTQPGKSRSTTKHAKDTKSWRAGRGKRRECSTLNTQYATTNLERADQLRNTRKTRKVGVRGGESEENVQRSTLNTQQSTWKEQINYETRERHEKWACGEGKRMFNGQHSTLNMQQPTWKEQINYETRERHEKWACGEGKRMFNAQHSMLNTQCSTLKEQINYETREKGTMLNPQRGE